MQLSPHFSLAELTRSNTAARRGLDNTPSKVMTEVLRDTARRMEFVRSACGNRSITVFSGYRSPAVNKAVGGSATSSHKDGQAVDFIVSGLNIAETVAILRKAAIPFDQLIDEFGSWVHIGFGPRMRGQVLKARTVDGKTTYNAM